MKEFKIIEFKKSKYSNEAIEKQNGREVFKRMGSCQYECRYVG